MEHKHFSHPHSLTFNQKPLKSETNCSDCKLPCSDTTSYACWECKFFLHPQCFHATRSIDHPSHPSHTLTLIPYPTYPSGSFICNSCNQPGFGFSFSCSKCDFDLHVHYTNSNFKSYPSTSSSSDQSKPKEKQKLIQHKSHPKHALNLLSPPPYPGGEFTCSACGENGKESTFHCKICEFDLHEKCADLPESKSREDHEHMLTLHYSVQLTEGSGNTYFICDVCFRNVNKESWMYYCAKCDFGTHVNCVTAKARSKEEVALEQHLAAQVELMNIQNRVRLNAAKADIIGSAFYGPRHHYY